MRSGTALLVLRVPVPDGDVVGAAVTGAYDRRLLVEGAVEDPRGTEVPEWDVRDRLVPERASHADVGVGDLLTRFQCRNVVGETDSHVDLATSWRHIAEAGLDEHPDARLSLGTESRFDRLREHRGEVGVGLAAALVLGDRMGGVCTHG